MKIFKIIKNTVVGIFLGAYLLFIVAVSSLLLSRNSYGVTQFGDKALIIIDDKISNDRYKDGDLVIVKKMEIEQLRVGDEVFVYNPNNKNKSIDVIVSTISQINTENPDNPYVVLTNGDGSWGIEYVAGVRDTIHNKIGKYLAIIQSKWIFFIILIVPCFFILLYEIYLLIVSIKYDDDDEEEEIVNKEPVKEKIETTENDKEDKVEDKVEVLEKTDEEVSKEKVLDKKEKETVEEKDIEDKKKEIIEKEVEKEEVNKKDIEKERVKEEIKTEDREIKKNIEEIEKDVLRNIDKHDGDYDKAAKTLISQSDDVEKELMMLKEKLLAEKKEKEKQENVERLLREINDLKNELDK